MEFHLQTFYTISKTKFENHRSTSCFLMTSLDAHVSTNQKKAYRIIFMQVGLYVQDNGCELFINIPIACQKLLFAFHFVYVHITAEVTSAEGPLNDK